MSLPGSCSTAWIAAATAIIGYALVSLDKQYLALQLNVLRAADAQAGDVLTVWRLDRLGRSIGDLITQVNPLAAARGIEFRSLTESIDTTNPGGRLTIHVFGAFSQFEREVLRGHDAGAALARGRGRGGYKNPVAALLHPPV